MQSHHRDNSDVPMFPAAASVDTGVSYAIAAPSHMVLDETVSSSRRLPRSISLESSAWIVLAVIAAVSRFWDLGSKTLHHDESLHTYYSWVFATGGGYEHHPLMHGPFLFHANALVYLLFGDTDATSRYMPALFGVMLVLLPYLLRGAGHLGRWGALAASFFLLVSPSILYQSRYIRHDIYTIVGTLLLFICIVRYLETPRRIWLVTGAGTVAFLLTNHEIVFAILVIFGGFLYGGFMLETVKNWRASERSRAIALIAPHALLVVAVVVLFVVTSAATKAELLDIPWSNPTRDQEWDYYKTVFSSPLVLGFIVILALFVAGMVAIFRRSRPSEPAADEPAAPSSEDTRGSFRYANRSLWTDSTGLLAALTAALAVFVPLYTSLFQNLEGLRSSTIATDGTLLYWLGQHDFRRGDQPWFYFLLLMAQYEYIAVLLGGVMALTVTIRTVLAAAGRDSGPNFRFRLFLTIWFVMIFLGLSYAGEKMPWLIVHIALPAILLAAVFAGGLVERIAGLIRSRDAAIDGHRLTWSDWALGGLLIIVGGAWFWFAAGMTFGVFSSTTGRLRRTVTEQAADDWWQLTGPWIVVVTAITIWAVWRGPRRTALVSLSAVLIGLSLLQVHAGWRMSYYEADVPKDMLIYTQTSPDVSRVMSEIDELSAQLTGGSELAVWYDSDVSWPFQWYLRNYSQKRFIGAALSSPPENAPVVLVGGTGASEAFLEGYTAQEYVLRWWFPEATYRRFAIAPELSPGNSAWLSADDPHGVFDILRSVGDTMSNQAYADHQLRLYRLLMYRDLDHPIGQTNFRIFVRNDLLPVFDSIRYGG
ncbi:hypothetical protein BH23CHL5_BH23CHL5_15430 [soil metagenome]